MATVDFAAVRSMDDFLINPTYSPDDAKSDMSEQQEEYSNVYALKHTHSKSSAHVENLNGISNEAALWQNYASDEEMASPIADDDLSFDDEEIIEDVVRVAYPVQLTQKAQAVVLRPVGKPRVISVQSPTSPRFPKFTHQIERRPVPSREASGSSGSEDERNSSVSSEFSNKSPGLSPASSISEKSRSIRRKPSQEDLVSERVPMTISSRRGSTPLNFMVPRSKHVVEAAPEPVSATVARQTDYSLRGASIDSTSSARAFTVSNPAAPSGQGKRRMQKISSTLNLNRFGSRSRGSRVEASRSSSTHSSDLETVQEPVILQPPPRSGARQKLVPRGANERAPVLRLPSYHRDVYFDEHEEHHEENEEDDGVWPLRVDSRHNSVDERWYNDSSRRSMSIDLSGQWRS